MCSSAATVPVTTQHSCTQICVHSQSTHIFSVVNIPRYLPPKKHRM